MSQKPSLGKGLASLLPPQMPPVSTAPTGATVAGAAEPVLNKDRHPGISLTAVDEIQINPFQPRREFDESAIEELSQSIQENGIIQPLVVRRTPMGYELIAGERRLRAAKKAGIKQVPIVIRKSTDKESLELALVENIQRRDLNCIDEALAYFQLMQDFTMTQEQVAQKVGKDRASVANHLRLLRLPEAIIDDLKRGILTLGHGKALLGLDDNEQRLRLRAEIVEGKLSVRETELRVEQLKQPSSTQTSAPSPAATPLASRMASLSQDLTRRWSAKVEVRGTEKKGKIVIHYGTRQELDRLIEAMHNG